MMKPICYCFSWDLRFPLINYRISCVRPAPRDPQPSLRPRCTTSSRTVRQLASGSSAHQGRSVSTEPRSVRLSFILCHFGSPPNPEEVPGWKTPLVSSGKASGWRKPSGRRMSFMCRWGQPKLLERQRSSVCQASAERVCVMTPVLQSISLIDHCVFRQTGCCELLRERCRTRRLALPPCSSSAGAEQSGTPAVQPATMDPDTPGVWSEAFCPLCISGDCGTGPLLSDVFSLFGFRREGRAACH